MKKTSLYSARLRNYNLLPTTDKFMGTENAKGKGRFVGKCKMQIERREKKGGACKKLLSVKKWKWTKMPRGENKK